MHFKLAWQEERRDASKENLFPFYFFFNILIIIISGCVSLKSKIYKRENFCHSLLVKK